MRQIGECSHKVELECGKIGTRADCPERCQKKMVCGHDCKLMCRQACDPSLCSQVVTMGSANFCGHKVSVACSQLLRSSVQGRNAFFDVQDDDQKEKLLLHCAHGCGSALACGHSCKGSCGGCLNGRVHETCREKCSRILVCGHSCSVDCAKMCPPCRKKCEYRCQHNKCGKSCGEPCSPCQVKSWNSSHWIQILKL